MLPRQRCFVTTAEGEGTNLKDLRRVEKEVALEDFEDVWEDIGAGGEEGDEEGEEGEHLGRQNGGAPEEDLPELEGISLKVDVRRLTRRKMSWMTEKNKRETYQCWVNAELDDWAGLRVKALGALAQRLFPHPSQQHNKNRKEEVKKAPGYSLRRAW